MPSEAIVALPPASLDRDGEPSGPACTFSDRLTSLLDELAIGRRLSAREREVLHLSACGVATKEIAFRLGIARKSVDEYWSRIYVKLGCSSALEAVALLLRRALDRGDDEQTYRRSPSCGSVSVRRP
jgi:DNA-binding CsgD family transcriptional regulator